MASEIPVVGYVYPVGARAASAGVFIMLACQVSAMAPGTNMGAAHPVAMGGQQPDSVMMGKIENDAVAFIRSIAEKRGRDADWAERSVRESVSVSAIQALRLGLIDYVAESQQELLEFIDGHPVSTAEGTTIISTGDAQEVNLSMRWFEKLLEILANPNIIYILLMIGTYGVIAFIQNPGSIFPGVIGFIALIFAFYGLQVLPINYAGLALIAVGIVLFILEVKIVSYGMLTIGGIVALILGTLLMFQSTPSFYGVSWPVIITVLAIIVAFLVLIVIFAVRTHVKKPTTGQQGMTGLIGEAHTDINPEGSIYVRGEYWTAETVSGKIKKGEKVKVVGMDGMKLKVEKD
jgi:membrane-bound serine protease (ClpP class)